MYDKEHAGPQAPLFEEIHFHRPLAEPEQMELQFHLSLVKGAKLTVRSPALRQDRREAELGVVVGTVDEKSLQRRNRLSLAGSYILSDPTPGAAMKWFRLYSPDDPSNERLDEFLKLFLLQVASRKLPEFLSMIQKSAATRKTSLA